METDIFFWNLFKQLPQTLFELLDLPPERASHYRFDSVELKKSSFRIDGLFIPTEANLPLYFVEVQFRRSQAFYANLFAKVFTYLEKYGPAHDWVAVAIFPSRSMEPKQVAPYEPLLQSKHVRRVYLDNHPMAADPPLGLGILQLLSEPVERVRQLVDRLVRRTHKEFADAEEAAQTIELVEELLMRRFAKLGREEIRGMFQLEDIRKTRVWQEAHEEGRQEGRQEGREAGRQEGREAGRQEGREEGRQEFVHKLLAKGLPLKEIAALLDTSVQEVRRLSKNGRR